jgi:cell division protease FtsH
MSKCQNFISSLQYSIIFLISIGCGTMYAPGLLPPSMMGGLSTPQVLQEDSPEIIEWHEVLKTTVNLLTKIDAIIEDILIMLNKGIMVLKNDEEAKRIISEIRMNVMAILHDQTNFLRVKKVEDLKRYCAYLMVLIDKLSDHLDTIVDSGFKRIQPFNFDLLHKRGVNTNISIASVKKQLITLNKQISELHEKEEYSNLAWYNIVARKFEKNIIIPWYQYKLGTAARVAFVSAATVTLLLWQLGSVHRQNQELSEIRNFARDFGYQELIKNYPDIADKYPLNNGHIKELKKGDLLNCLDHQRGIFSTREPFHGKPHDDGKYLIQTDINFIGDAFKAYFEQTFQKSKLSRFLVAVPNMLGLAEPTSPYGGIDFDQKARNIEKYSLGSTLLYLADNVARGHFAMIGLVGSFAWGTYKEIWGDGLPGSAQAWLTEKGFDLWNFLRGGAHLQQTMSLDFNPTLTFDDVIGMDEVKEELKFLLSFIENPEMFIRSGKIPERGYLLTGPTRSGKSFIVEALCGEINKRLRALGRSKEFKFRKIPPFLITNAGVERILHWAKSEAPIILWIDEIDLLDLQRVGDKKTLMAFLTGMGNSFDNDPTKLVIIIGCTNRPENMDFALKQYGRFGKEIRFEYPSAEYRRKFIIKQLQSMGLDPRYFDIEALTYKTEGQHFEAIKAFIKGASVKAWMYGKVIDQDLLDESFDTEIRHILAVERKTLSDTEREILATYFAGKALAHALLDTRGQLDRVTIRPIMVKLEETWAYEHLTDKEKQAKGDDHKIQYGQVFTKHLNDTAKINTYEQALNEIKILEAGFAAEEVMFGVSTYSCHPEDSMSAYKAAEAIEFEGLDRTRIGKKQLEKLTEKSYMLKKRCHEEVKKLLEQYKSALIALIDALKKDATLSDNQVMTIIEQAMIEEEIKEEELADNASENKEDVIPSVQEVDVQQ